MKEFRQKRIHVEQLYLYQVLRNANLNIMAALQRFAWVRLGQKSAKGKKYKGTWGKFWSDWYGHFSNYNNSFTGVQMLKHQIVHLKNVEWILCQLDLDTAVQRD